ncbi:MAG: hypothetical protein WC841_02215 [Candidatus Shapirobacteria bacterium]|jgi:hypothetical protein
MKDLREELAKLEHLQWTCWSKFMLNNLTEENIAKWKKQINTPYNELTDQEKQSDRKWADKVLEIIQK